MIKLNTFKLYVHLLGVLWSLFSSFFFSLLGFHNVLVERYTSYFCFFPRGQIFSLGICLTRLTIPRSAEFIQMISFFFSLPSLRGLFLEFGFISYPKLCSWFFHEQRQLLMRLHPVITTWQLRCVFTLRWMNGHGLIFCSLKMPHVLIFPLAISSSVPNMVEGLPLRWHIHG